ncbi:hypothetical protein ACHAXT_008350 [Thalassiosira profunda]
MSNGTKAASAAMQTLRRRRPRTGAISKQQRPPPSCSISSTSANSSGARAAAATVSWELSGSTIIAKNARPAKSIDKPSWAELQNLFATSALPMVGFGFMDNFIMIQAGGYIDSTLGVKFGLTTLTAAAMGQVVSDVSGVLCGSTVDSAITRLGLVKPNNMSPAKRRLRLSKRVSLAGAVVGVILGCGLGATSLWFVSHHNHEDQQNVDKTRGILSNMLNTPALIAMTAQCL